MSIAAATLNRLWSTN